MTKLTLKEEEEEETIAVCCHRKFEEFADGKITTSQYKLWTSNDAGAAPLVWGDSNC